MAASDLSAPLVTVVMPAWNTAPFIGDAIASVLTQTVGDLELIVVDDGSHDGTADIARDWASRDPRVRVIVNDVSRGAGPARNQAMREATSPYIAFLDSDDLWRPAFLATQLAAFDAFPDASVVTGNVTNFGGPKDGRPYRPFDAGRRRVPLIEMLEREDAICIMSVFRREVFATTGGFDESVCCNEDYDFWLRTAAAGFVFVQTCEPVGLYRRRPDSLSTDEVKMLVGIVNVLERARAYCAGCPAEQRAINRQIVRFRQERLTLEGKSALRQRQFKAAASCFRELHRRQPSVEVAMLAAVTDYAPWLVFWADRVRRSTRHARAPLRASWLAMALLVQNPAAFVPRYVMVHAGDDLQHVLNVARPGDTILLEASATFVGNFVLPAKAAGDTRPIIIRSAGADLPPGKRISPENARQLAKLQSPNDMPALLTDPRAHHWRIELVEFRSAPGGSDEMVSLGDGSSAQRTLLDVPSDLVVDRVYVHGDPSVRQKRGIGLNASRVTISNSYISDFKAVGQDSQAIAGWNGPGDYLIENNYVEAAGENIIFGGTDPSIPNLTPTNIVIRGNTVRKPVQWRESGEGWQVKNLFELKNARRVTIDGNLFENNWQAAQSGFSILFTVRNDDGGCTWCQVEQVTFTNNIVRHVAAGFSILGFDDIHPSRQTQGIVIRNNLIHDLDAGTWGGNGYAFLILGAPRDVSIDHNTIVNENSSGIIQADGPPVLGFSFTNNLVLHGAYGIIGTDHAPGNDSISAFFPGSRFAGNVIAGAAGSYPSGNRYPSVSEFRQQFASYGTGNYQLAPGSSFRGSATDATDVGVTFATLVRDVTDNRAPRRTTGH